MMTATNWTTDPYPKRSDGVRVLRDGQMGGKPAYVCERPNGSVLSKAAPRGGRTMPRKFGSHAAAMAAADRHWPL